MRIKKQKEQNVVTLRVTPTFCWKTIAQISYLPIFYNILQRKTRVVTKI